jgi:outer membrane immunogenic protein
LVSGAEGSLATESPTKFNHVKEYSMRKMNLLVATAGIVLAAACQPAEARANDFGGIYVAATAGVADVNDTDITYGANAGVNIPLGDAIVGVEATVDDVLEDQREFGASARLGYTFDQVMLYGEAGYANYQDAFSRKLDGLRVGGGLEYNISDNTYVGAEYRYTDFEAGVGKHAGQVSLGIRF